MSIPISDIILQIQEIYADCDETTALRMLNRIYRRICTEYAIETSIVQQTLVAGTDTYAFLPEWTAIRSATYKETSEGDFTVLETRNVQEMDRLYRPWRQISLQTPGRPLMFMIDGPNVIYYPRPWLTSNGATPPLPRVELSVCTYTPFTNSDVLSSVFRDEQAFVSGVCFLYARAFVPEDMASHAQMFIADMDSLERFLASRNLNHIDQASPDTFGVAFV